jgi:hypothetical protein
MPSKTKWAPCLCLLLGIAAGCGNSHSFEVAPVEGTVTLDGEPVTRGLVTFIPDEKAGTKGPIGVGKIDQNGSYRIVTLPNSDSLNGAIVGRHRIRVSHFASDRYSETRDAVRLYSSETTSGLTAEVKPGMTNAVDLSLETPSPES